MKQLVIGLAAALVAFGAPPAMAADELYGLVVSSNPQGFLQTSITPGLRGREICEAHNKSVGSQILRGCDKCKIESSTCSAALDKRYDGVLSRKPISLPYLFTATERVVYAKAGDPAGATILCDYTATIMRNRLNRTEAVCISPWQPASGTR